jgi:hypothetical protein
MAYSNKKVEAVEQALLEACKTDREYEEADDSHLTRKKRDKITAHIDNQVKKLKADEAMEKSKLNKIEQGTFDGEIEVITGEGAEIQAEREYKFKEQKKKSEELTSKMEKYKGGNKKIQHPAFNGLHLNEMQKKFIVNYCDPDSPHFSDKHNSYIAAGYTAKNKNSLMANISMNLKKEKIKTAIERYRKSMISSKRMEISTETVDLLRKRATYSITTFFEFKNGKKVQKPLEEIPQEWHCCIDNIKDGYQTSKGIYLAEYILCDRQKSIDALNKLLEVQHSISEAPKNVGGRPSSVQAAIDMGKDKDGNQGPRVIINMSLFEDD